MIQYTPKQLEVWANQILQLHLIEKLDNDGIINWIIEIIKNINSWVLDQEI